MKRFWDKVKKKDGCWEWTAGLFRNGYGAFVFQGKLTQAHRVSYVISVEDIPDGMVIDHLCRNHKCVNPSHLEVVTQRENNLRGFSPPAINARKTHCEHGHEFTTANTYIRKDRQGRECRICRNNAAYTHQGKLHLVRGGI